MLPAAIEGKKKKAGVVDAQILTFNQAGETWKLGHGKSYRQGWAVLGSHR